MAKIDVGGNARSGLIILVGPEDGNAVDYHSKNENGSGASQRRNGDGDAMGSSATLFASTDATSSASLNPTNMLSRISSMGSFLSINGWTGVGVPSSSETEIADDEEDARRYSTRRKMTLLSDIAQQMGIALQQAVLNEEERLRTSQLAEKNEALIQARKEVQVAQAHKDFTAVMSHEMRTPLFAISSLTSMILDMPGLQSDDPDLLEAVYFLGVIRNSSQMLITIVNNILDFAKYEDNELALDRNPFNLRVALETAAEIVATQDQTESYPPILSFYEDNVPEIVVGDETRFMQIVINLVANACKFTERSGSVTVRVCALDDTETPSKLKIQVSVQDTGIGINLNDASKLFQRFTQADTGTTRKFGGTGLGLSIAKHLCEMMGGSINVSANVDEPGTQFTFWVLMESYIPEAWPGKQFPAPLLKLTSEQAADIKFALVDGNIGTALEIESLLRKCGVVSIARYQTLQNAFSASESTPFSALIVDCGTVKTQIERDQLHLIASSSIGCQCLYVCCIHSARREYRRYRRADNMATILTRPAKLSPMAKFVQSIIRHPPTSFVLPTPLPPSPSVMNVINTSGLIPSVNILPGTPDLTSPLSIQSSTTETKLYVSEPKLTTARSRSLDLGTRALVSARRASGGNLLSPQRLSSDNSVSVSPRSSDGEGLGLSSSTSNVGSGRMNIEVLPTFNILLVEDNKVNQLVITKMLEKLGQRCEVAEDGVYAIEKLIDPSGPKFDIVLMDIMMPRKDGYQTTQELRRHTKDNNRPWVIALSANAFWDDRIRCMDVGMNDFIRLVTLKILSATKRQDCPLPSDQSILLISTTYHIPMYFQGDIAQAVAASAGKLLLVFISDDTPDSESLDAVVTSSSVAAFVAAKAGGVCMDLVLTKPEIPSEEALLERLLKFSPMETAPQPTTSAATTSAQIPSTSASTSSASSGSTQPEPARASASTTTPVPGPTQSPAQPPARVVPQSTPKPTTTPNPSGTAAKTSTTSTLPDSTKTKINISKPSQPPPAAKPKKQTPVVVEAPTPKIPPSTEFAALAIRLMDGTTVRNKFRSEQTLGDVRKYLDKEVKGLGAFDLAQTFPSRLFMVGDESKTLLELELAPSASLILKKSTSFQAYPGSGSGGVVTTVINGIYTPISMILSVITIVLTKLFSLISGQPSTPPPAAPDNTKAGPSSTTTRKVDTAPSVGSSSTSSGSPRKTGVHTMSQMGGNDKPDEQSTYNGNSTSQGW
ncbi:hypothetical protein HDU76_013847 [Blyttiomyces sp. JEL0837]|nr:hypothetical protein HDU76_013847 [Blyttiomyces sp. JEL0837]